MLGHFREQGDTIIEVLLAITIFSMVSIGAMTIMNQGTNAAQRALEITQVRQQIDAQAEALRAAQQAYTANPVDGTWTDIAQSTSTANYTDDSACPTSQVSDSILMDARTAKQADNPDWYNDINDIGNVSGSAPYAQVSYDSGDPESYGMWIERVYTAGDGTIPNSYEFIIKACWFGAGLSHPLNLETSVRLYDPAA